MRNKKNPTYFLVGGASVSSVLWIVGFFLLGALLMLGILILLGYLEAVRGTL